MNSPTQTFVNTWVERVDCSTGLPCGVLRDFIQQLSTMPLHTPGLNEREAVGIAAGMWLAGRNPLLYMQNSGMLVASNDIGSLLIPCEMEIPFVVTWRGAPGESAPQHFATGAATKPLLSAYGMWHEELTEFNAGEIYRSCRNGMATTKKPGVILVKRGWTKGADESIIESPRVSDRPTTKSSGEILDLRHPQASLLREQALTVIHQTTPEQVGLVSSTGLISRSLFARHHSRNQFYNAGGFGLTSAIGMGFALARPDKQVVVVEGDSSCLTNFGNLVNMGHHSPQNLVHVVVDNNAYGSCSEEPSIAQSARFAQAAALMGYQAVFQVNSAEMLHWAVARALAQKQLSMVHVQIQLGGDRDFARPLSMAQNAREFQAHMR